MSQEIDLNDRFRHALHLLENSKQHLFITGKAGTGKSTLLSEFCKSTGKKPVVLAPTGVAALNVRGQTIHKFFHFYIDVTPEKIRRGQVKPRSMKLYQKLQTIVIDEISMVRADLLDCIDEFLRMYGPEKNQPFGGVQMVFVGDLHQLPPVVSQDSEEIFSTHYDTPYFFSARCLKDADFTVIELDKIYRQKEQHFVDILNRIREGDVADDDITQLNQRYDPQYKPDPAQFFIHLTTTNRKADEINAAHLAALPAKLNTTNAIIQGEFGRESFPTATELQFKIGAQIMLINNDTQGRWVNGTIGAIEAVKRDEKDRAYLEIRIEDERNLVPVYPHTWEMFRYKLAAGEITADSVGSFTQFPIRLAWAVTIHKAQGKTFEHVLIDLDRGAFAAGQVYVALSRCTTLEGIVLKTPITRRHIHTDARIVEFLDRYPYVPAEITPTPATKPITDPRGIIALLTSGIDPISGLPMESDSPYLHPTIITALQALLAGDIKPPKTKSKTRRASTIRKSEVA